MFYKEIDTLEEVPSFDIERLQLYDSYQNVVPNTHVLRNIANGHHLGVVSDRYRPIQLDEMLDIFKNVFKEYDISPLGYAIIDHGKLVVIQSEIDFSSHFDQGDDVYDTYIYAIIDNTGKGANKFIASTIRTVCTNALNVVNKGAKFTLRHSMNFDEKVSTSLKQMSQTLENFAMFGETVNAFRNLLFSEAQMEGFAKVLIPSDEHKQNMLIHLFKNGIGTNGETKYDALNAVTEFDTHFSGRKTKTLKTHVRKLINSSLSSNAFKLLNTNRDFMHEEQS